MHDRRPRPAVPIPTFLAVAAILVVHRFALTYDLQMPMRNVTAVQVGAHIRFIGPQIPAVPSRASKPGITPMNSQCRIIHRPMTVRFPFCRNAKRLEPFPKLSSFLWLKQSHIGRGYFYIDCFQAVRRAGQCHISIRFNFKRPFARRMTC
ncbi:hypothetical protein D3C73_1036780 [compost metagenome]